VTEQQRWATDEKSVRHRRIVMRSYLFVTLALSALPLILIQLGVLERLEPGKLSTLFALLELSCFSSIFFVVSMGFVRNFLHRTSVVAVFVVPQFWAGLMDAYQLLSVQGVMFGPVEPETFLPVSWFVIRSFHALALLAALPALLILVRRGQLHSSPLVAITNASVAVAAIGAFYLIANPEVLPAPFLSALVPSSGALARPLELIPLGIYLAWMAVTYAVVFRRTREPVAFLLTVSLLPLCFAQLHMIFGADAPSGPHMFGAHVLKLGGYVMPYVGLAIEYVWTLLELQSKGRSLRQAKIEGDAVNLQLQDAIAQAQQLAVDAKSANEAKSQFLANVSHEIRTPMAAIIGFSDLLNDEELSADQHRSLDRIRGSAEALLELINSVLDLSKIEAGRIELEEMPIDVGELVCDAAELVWPRCAGKPVDVLADCGALPRYVFGDPTRLRQVLVNLLGNAVKFTPKGEVVVSASTVAQEEGRATIALEVRDTGIGIPADKLMTIFQAFSQVDGSTTRQYGGTGLGLTISRRLVELMGGELKLESEVDVGSRFFFELSFEVLEAEVPSSRQVDERWRGSRALVIDASEVAREIHSTMLRRLGLEVEASADLEQGLARHLRAAFDVVLLAPGADGVPPIEVWQGTADRAPPIILVANPSGGPGGRFEDRSDQVANLYKPLRPEVLADALRHELFGREANDGPLRQVAEPEAAERSVLVAEDNPDTQRFIVEMLARLGFQAEVVADGELAVKEVRARPWDAVLMDLQMPRLGGLDATRMLRQEGYDLPIIAFTASAMAEDRERCMEAGMNDYLTKPVRREELRRALERAMERGHDH